MPLRGCCVPFVQNRPELWKLHNLAKEYGKLPSEVLHLDSLVGSWERYQFDNAVFSFGRMVENELAKNAKKKKGQRKKPEAILRKLLYPDSKPAYAPLAARAQAVKLMPGESPHEALLRELRHG